MAKSSTKPYRFFYHYYKAKQKMTVHFRGKCHTVKHIRCLVPCETKWNAAQPNIVMQGFAHDVVIDTVTDTATIRGEM